MRVGIPITGLSRDLLCPKPGSGFLTSYVVVCFALSVQLILEVIVRFVDIGGIDDHLCLNFISIITSVLWLFNDYISRFKTNYYLKMVMTATLHFKQNDLAGKLNMKYTLSAYAKGQHFNNYGSVCFTVICVIMKLILLPI